MQWPPNTCMCVCSLNLHMKGSHDATKDDVIPEWHQTMKIYLDTTNHIRIATTIVI